VSERRLESAAYLAETLCHEDCQCGNTPEQGGHCDSCTAKHIEARDLAVVRAVLELTAKNFDGLRDTSRARGIRAMVAHPDEVLAAITQPRRDGGADE
jgi:hypothetical protein